MRTCLAFCAVLFLSAIANGAIIYDAGTFTLQYGDPADLGAAADIDPIGVLADVNTEYGLTKAQIGALNPQVIGFNTAPSAFFGTPQVLTVKYNDADTLTFNFAAKYNWGGATSNTRSATSGTAAYHDLSGVETQPDNCWFSTTIANSNPDEGIGAWGMAVKPNSAGPAGAGQAIFTLSGGTTEVVDYGTLASPDTYWIGYQAPAGQTITGIRCTRPGGGNSFVAMDDFSFTIVPEPVTMGLLLVGGLVGLIRRRRA